MSNPKLISLDCPSFFEVMIGDFITLLKIRPKFRKHLGESIMQMSVVIRSSRSRQGTVRIILQDPRGTSCTVRLSSWHNGRLWSSSGWADVYRKAQLKEGDVCVLEFVQECSAINVHFFQAEEYNAKSMPASDERPSDVKEIVPRLLTADDKESVPNAPESSESSHPKFTILWKPNHLYHVGIPKKKWQKEVNGLCTSFSCLMGN